MNFKSPCRKESTFDKLRASADIVFSRSFASWACCKTLSYCEKRSLACDIVILREKSLNISRGYACGFFSRLPCLGTNLTFLVTEIVLQQAPHFIPQRLLKVTIYNFLNLIFLQRRLSNYLYILSK